MQSEAKVTREIAKLEVEKWLDFKRVKESKREGLEAQIEAMEEGFMDGTLVLDELTHEIRFNLQFAVGENDSIKYLTVKPRMSVGTTQSFLKGVKSGDGDGRVQAYICAMTGQISGVVSKIDTEDYGLLSSIAVFFF